MAKNSTQTLDQAYREILEELFQMFLRKHRDYGKGNILSVGELGIALRVTEKIERIKHLLMQQGVPTNESIEETWTDIAVYAILAKLHRQGKFAALEVDPKVLEQ